MMQKRPKRLPRLFFTRGPRWLLPREKRTRRRINITFTGDEGRPWRIAAGAAAGLLLLLIVVLASRTGPQLMNSAEILTLQDRGVLRVGVRTDMPGMGMEGTGLECELAKRLSAYILPETPADNSYRLIDTNAMTVAPRFNSGDIDAAIALMPKDASSKYAYSQAYYTDPCYFIAAQNATTLSLHGIRIGCVQSTPSDTLLTAYIAARPDAELTRVPFASYPDMLHALMRGQLDLAVMTQLYINKYQQETTVDQNTMLSHPSYTFKASSVCIGNVEYAIAASVDTPAIAQLADRMLSQMREDGSLDALYTQFGLVQD